jgi:hypothetical protein
VKLSLPARTFSSVGMKFFNKKSFHDLNHRRGKREERRPAVDLVCTQTTRRESSAREMSCKLTDKDEKMKIIIANYENLYSTSETSV